MDTHRKKVRHTKEERHTGPKHDPLGSFRLSVGPMLSRDNQIVPTNNRLLALAVCFTTSPPVLVVAGDFNFRGGEASSLQIARYFLGGDPTITDFSFHGRRAIKQ